MDDSIQIIERAAAKQDGGKVLILRVVATWIDFGVLLAGVIALYGIQAAVATDPADPERKTISYLFLLALIIFIPGYYILCEGLWGRTVGKLITRLVVVGPEGQKPGLGRATLRTLLRLLEVNPFLIGGLPAGIVYLCSKTRRRLGDMVANTYVLPLKDLKAAMAKEVAVFD